MQNAEIDNLNLVDVKLKHLDIRKSVKYKWLRQIEFTGYLFFSMIIHVVMLIAGKTLLIAEWIKNKLTGKPSRPCKGYREGEKKESPENSEPS